MVMYVNVNSSVFQNLNLCNEKLIKKSSNSCVYTKYFSRVDHFTVIKDKIKDKSTDINNIEFKTKNSKKAIGFTEIVNFLNMLTELVNDVENLTTEDLIKKIKDYYGCRKDYLNDLNRVCKYFMQDRLKNQGGKAFHCFIKEMQHLVNAIIKIIDIKEDNKEIKFNKIVNELAENIVKEDSVSLNKAKYGAIAIGGTIGFCGCLALKTCVLSISKLFVCSFISVTLSVILTLGLASICTAGSAYGLFKFYQYFSYNNMFARIEDRHKLESPTIFNKECNDTLKDFKQTKNLSYNKEKIDKVVQPRDFQIKTFNHYIYSKPASSSLHQEQVGVFHTVSENVKVNSNNKESGNFTSPTKKLFPICSSPNENRKLIIEQKKNLDKMYDEWIDEMLSSKINFLEDRNKSSIKKNRSKTQRKKDKLNNFKSAVENTLLKSGYYIQDTQGSISFKNDELNDGHMFFAEGYRLYLDMKCLLENDDNISSLNGSSFTFKVEQTEAIYSEYTELKRQYENFDKEYKRIKNKYTDYMKEYLNNYTNKKDL